MPSFNNSRTTASTNTAVVFGSVGLIVVLLLLSTSRAVAAWVSPTTPSSTTTKQQPDDGETSNRSDSNVCPVAANTDSESCDSKALQQPQQQAMVDQRDSRLLLYNVESTTSTQEEAKRLIESSETISDTCIPFLTSGDKNDKDLCCFAVTATEQSNGRGTSGRVWMGSRGNTFVTIGIPQAAWMSRTGLPLTLLPLKIGTIVASRVSQLLQNLDFSSSPSPPLVTVKWPNDVLVDHKKIAGILIESARDEDSNYWMLIGIGVNVAYAPTVPTSGPNNGRPATSIRQLQEELQVGQEKDRDSNSLLEMYIEMARQLGNDMAYDLGNFLWSSSPLSTSLQQEVLREWKGWVDWDMKLVLRDGVDKIPVTPVDIHLDGRLKVRDETGVERLVVTDYFI